MASAKCGAHKALARRAFAEKHPVLRVGGAEGAPYSGAPYRIEIIRARLFILAALQGAFLRGGYPGLKPG